MPADTKDTRQVGLIACLKEQYIAPSNTMQPVAEESEPSPDDIPTQNDTFRSTAATAQTVMSGASKWLKQVGKTAQEAAIAAGHTAQEAAASVSGAVDQYSSQVRRDSWMYISALRPLICHHDRHAFARHCRHGSLAFPSQFDCAFADIVG